LRSEAENIADGLLTFLNFKYPDQHWVKNFSPEAVEDAAEATWDDTLKLVMQSDDQHIAGLLLEEDEGYQLESDSVNTPILPVKKFLFEASGEDSVGTIGTTGKASSPRGRRSSVSFCGSVRSGLSESTMSEMVRDEISSQISVIKDDMSKQLQSIERMIQEHLPRSNNIPDASEPDRGGTGRGT